MLVHILQSHLLFLCTSYLPSQVSYSLRRLTAFQTQNLYIGPQCESELSHTKAPGVNPLFPGLEAKPDPIKGGLRVTGFFTYNCLAVSVYFVENCVSLEVTLGELYNSNKK